MDRDLHTVWPTYYTLNVFSFSLKIMLVLSFDFLSFTVHCHGCSAPPPTPLSRLFIHSHLVTLAIFLISMIFL